MTVISVGPVQIDIADNDSQTAERVRSYLEDAIDASIEELQDDGYEISLVKPEDDQPVGVRSDDPDTSKQAALEAYPRSGKQRHKALLAIARARDRGLTYEQVEEATGINSVWKRLSELKDGGWITIDGTRKIQKTGSNGFVYKITERARKHIEIKEKAGVLE